MLSHKHRDIHEGYSYIGGRGRQIWRLVIHWSWGHNKDGKGSGPWKDQGAKHQDRAVPRMQAYRNLHKWSLLCREEPLGINSNCKGLWASCRWICQDARVSDKLDWWSLGLKGQACPTIGLGSWHLLFLTHQSIDFWRFGWLSWLH